MNIEYAIDRLYDTGWLPSLDVDVETLADGRRCVNHADIFRSDYVANALRGHFDASRLVHINSRELIRRMACLGLCIAHLPSAQGGGLFASLFGKKEKTVARTRLWLVSAERRDFDDPAPVPAAPLQGGGAGYRFQFVTLAGFHALNHSMFELARGYRDRGMAAYSELQQGEFASETDGYSATRHQREVGTGYFDAVSQAVSSGTSSTTAMDGSTEVAQFEHGLRKLA